MKPIEYVLSRFPQDKAEIDEAGHIRTVHHGTPVAVHVHTNRLTETGFSSLEEDLLAEGIYSAHVLLGDQHAWLRDPGEQVLGELHLADRNKGTQDIYDLSAVERRLFDERRDLIYLAAEPALIAGNPPRDYSLFRATAAEKLRKPSMGTRSEVVTFSTIRKMRFQEVRGRLAPLVDRKRGFATLDEVFTGY